MQEETIKLTVEGLAHEGGHVRLRSFLQELEGLGKALGAAERLIAREKRPTLYFVIVGLSHSSPATVELKPACTDPAIDTREAVLGKFLSALDAIQQGKEVPPWVDSDLLRHIERIAKPVGRTVQSAQISGARSLVKIDTAFQGKIDRLLATEDYALGSVSGRLEKINVHAGANTFEIYPSVGPERISCWFPSVLEDAAITSIKQWVTVTGKLAYKGFDRFPYRVEVTKIEIHPPAEELPKLSDLKGVAPEATGSLESEIFVRRLRNEWR